MKAFLSTLVLFLALAPVALAKPLYLTVNRSFSTHESPVLELAFEAKGPVQLRILRPNSLEAFLAAQSDLRRSYEAPETRDNPGRALSRGLNGIKSPGAFLLFSMKKEFRTELGGVLPARPVELPGRAVGKLSEGQPKLVGIPKGMTLVRSEWLNLDLGGAKRDYNVPGFEDWGSVSGYQDRRVTLPPLPAGLYVVQLVQGAIEGQVLLVVTDLTVQVKQSDGVALVRVAGVDQEAKRGVAITVRSAAGGATLASAVTDDKGEALLKVDSPRLVVTASLNQDTALVDTDFYSTLSVTPDVFLYSDRPIYHPGDAVKFRGVVRRPDSFLARLFVPRRREVTLTLATDTGVVPGKTKATVDEFGCFSGTLTAPKEATTGVLRVVATLDEHAHQSEARVQDYVKPTFYLELTSENETITPGGKLTSKLRARRYAGGVPVGTAFEVYLYKTVLDTPAWVDDSGRGGAGSVVTYGTPSTTEGNLSIPERLYSSLEARQGEGEDPWATATKLDAQGEATITVDVPALKPGQERLPLRYALSVRARDKDGTFANTGTSFFLSPTEILATLRMSTPLAASQAKVTLAVRSTTLSGKPFPHALGSVAFLLRKADGSESKQGERAIQTGDDGVARMDVPTPGAGTVVARVTLNDKQGHPWSGETSLYVLGAAGEAVARVPALTLQSLDAPLEPGEDAQVVGLLPEHWGPGGDNRGSLWVTLAGAGIFHTELLKLSGQTLTYRLHVEQRFGSAVYVSVAHPTATGTWEERTLPFRIVPRERALGVSVQAQRTEVAPLGEQSVDLRVTNSEGHGVVAQVSVGVVDKAVYAVQSEFRPRVLDFFYPVGRNNVATFSSSEFQGYGYGEKVVELMRGLPGYAFASVKPPSRQVKDQDRDTAFWSPNVVTDAEGRATVHFSMPSNQTLWTVTAVAADASGRFGEGQGEFASRGALSLVASVPQFLREGDDAIGSVRLSRGADSKAKGPFSVQLAAEGGVTTPAKTTLVPVERGGEQSVPLPLTAKSVGVGSIRFAVDGSGEPLKGARAVPVIPAAVEETLSASGWGGGELLLPVSAHGQVETAELLLQPTVLDAALSNIRELLTYPYGCLEQLVSTTLPNLAVYQTLKKVQGLEQLDPESQALLAEARSRAVQGIDRILALQVKNAGFTWFAGYSTPDVALTLIALDGLTYAADAGFVDRVDPRVVQAASWLEKQTGLAPELEATRVYVLARLNGKRQAAQVRSFVSRAEPTSDLYPIALAVLAADSAGIVHEPELEKKIQSLVQLSRAGFVKLATYTPTDDAFWRFPLRRVGLSAIVAHAASFGEVDVAAVRRRLLESLARDDLSTFDRSTALLHSLWLIERDVKTLKALPPPKVEGVATLAFARRGGGLVAVIPASVRKLTVGSFEGVATFRARVLTPLAELKPKANGMEIARQYYVLSAGGKRALGPADMVSQGQEVYVELTVNARGTNHERSAYYVVEDAVPAGFTPIGEDKAYRAAPYGLPLAAEALRRRTLSPEKATFFFEEPAWWSDSPRVIGYVMRAQFAGHFRAPPATISDMYATALRGQTGPAVLNVAVSQNAP